MPDDLSLVHFYWGSAHPKKPPLHVTRNLALWSKKLEDTKFIPILWCNNNTFQGIEDNIHSTNTRDNSVASVAGMPIDGEKWQRIPEGLRDHPLWQDHHLAPNLVLPKTWLCCIPQFVRTIVFHARTLLWLCEGDSYGTRKGKRLFFSRSSTREKIFKRRIFVVNIEDFLASHVQKIPLLQFFLYYLRASNNHQLFSHGKDIVIPIIVYMLGGFYFDIDISCSREPFPHNLTFLQDQYTKIVGATKSHLFKLLFFDHTGTRVESDVGILFCPFAVDLTVAVSSGSEYNREIISQVSLLGLDSSSKDPAIREIDSIFQRKLTTMSEYVQQYQSLYSREHPSFEKPYFSRLYPTDKKPLEQQLCDQDRKRSQRHKEWYKRYLKAVQHQDQRAKHWKREDWLDTYKAFARPPLPPGSMQSPIDARIFDNTCPEADQYKTYLLKGKFILRDEDKQLNDKLLGNLDIFYRRYIEPCTMHEMNIRFSNLCCGPYRQLERYDKATTVLENFFYDLQCQRVTKRIQRILDSKISHLISEEDFIIIFQAYENYRYLGKSERMDLYSVLDRIERQFFYHESQHHHCTIL